MTDGSNGSIMQIRDVYKTYVMGEEIVHALQGISLTINAGSGDDLIQVNSLAAGYATLTIDGREVTVDKGTTVLEAAQQMMGCAEDSECMAGVSASMRSDLLLTGSVGAIGNNMLVNLTLIDVRAARPVGRMSETVAGIEPAVQSRVVRVGY